MAAESDQFYLRLSGRLFFNSLPYRRAGHAYFLYHKFHAFTAILLLLCILKSKFVFKKQNRYKDEQCMTSIMQTLTVLVNI